MKRVIIVHCWEGYPEYCWYQSTKKELEALGFQASVPAFPHTELPTQEDWVPFLAQQIGTPDKNLYLIGHSVGCITILRYLETLPANQKIGGAVLVAGYTDDLGYKELENFYQFPINFGKVKARTKNGFVLIHSTDDPYVDLKYGDTLKKELDAELIVKENMGHFSGSPEDPGSCTELPDIAESVKRLSLKP